MSKRIRFCPFCGKEVAPDGNFCRSCGNQYTKERDFFTNLASEHHKLSNVEPIPQNTYPSSEATKSQNADESTLQLNDPMPAIVVSQVPVAKNKKRKKEGSFKGCLAFIVFMLMLFAFIGMVVSGMSGSSSASNTLKTTAANNSQIPFPLPPVSSGSKRVSIKDVGSIDIPSGMRVQPKELQNAVKKVEEDAGIKTGDNTTIFMQEGMSNYSRIIIRTIVGKQGDYEKLRNPIILNASEIKELDKLYRTEVSENLAKLQGMKLLQWYPVEVKKVNGMDTLNIRYLRQLKDNVPVIVYVYLFFNYDRMIVLEMAYRQSEKHLWENDFNSALSTFRITNIR